MYVCLCVCVRVRVRACVRACVRTCVRACVQAASAEMQAQLFCEKESRAEAESSLAMSRSEVSTLSAEIVSLCGLHEAKIVQMAAKAYEEASMAQARSNEALEQERERERERELGEVENWRARVMELQHEQHELQMQHEQHELQRVSRYTLAQVQTR